MDETSTWRTVGMIPAQPGHWVRHQNSGHDDEPVALWLLQETVDVTLIMGGYPNGTRVVAGVLDRDKGEIVPLDADSRPGFEQVILVPETSRS